MNQAVHRSLSFISFLR